MAGVRALLTRVLLPVSVIIWLIMRAVIAVRATSTENICRAENHLSNSPLKKKTAVHIHVQTNFYVCRRERVFKTPKGSILFLIAHTKLLRKVAGSIPTSVSGFLIDIKYFRSHYGPGVDSASNRNEYQEYFLGVKAACA